MVHFVLESTSLCSGVLSLRDRFRGHHGELSMPTTRLGSNNPQTGVLRFSDPRTLKAFLKTQHVPNLERAATLNDQHKLGSMLHNPLGRQKLKGRVEDVAPDTTIERMAISYMYLHSIWTQAIDIYMLKHGVDWLKKMQNDLSLSVEEISWFFGFNNITTDGYSELVQQTSVTGADTLVKWGNDSIQVREIIKRYIDRGASLIKKLNIDPNADGNINYMKQNLLPALEYSSDSPRTERDYLRNPIGTPAHARLLKAQDLMIQYGVPPDDITNYTAVQNKLGPDGERELMIDLLMQGSDAVVTATQERAKQLGIISS